MDICLVRDGAVDIYVTYTLSLRENLTPASGVGLAVLSAAFPLLPVFRTWSSGLPLIAAVSFSPSPALPALGVVPQTHSLSPSHSLVHIWAPT
jgi:hypothetical protein